MKSFYLFLLTIFFPGFVSGQNVFWSENFSSGGIGWGLNLSGPGTNDALSNEWIINSNNSNCPSCGISGGNYLHVTCSSEDSVACPTYGGPSCVYNAGGWFPIQTDKYVSSPDISTIGKTNITLKFSYFSVGEPVYDYAIVRLSNNGGVTWADLAFQYAGFANCQQENINIPSLYENIPNFRFGFRWINNDNWAGTDPSFSVDDIELVGDTMITSIKNYFSPGSSILLYPNPASEKTTLTILSGRDDNYRSINTLIISDIYGRAVDEIKFQENKTVISTQNFSSGIYFYRIFTARDFISEGKMAVIK